MAQSVIAAYLRRNQDQIKYRFFRRIGLFEATIYLEDLDFKNGESAILHANSCVHIFGEFSPEIPWQVMVPCRYDPYWKCFRVDIVIRAGQQFKFAVDNGKHYMISERYPLVVDSEGNVNNLFDPKQILQYKVPRHKDSYCDNQPNGLPTTVDSSGRNDARDQQYIYQNVQEPSFENYCIDSPRLPEPKSSKLNESDWPPIDNTKLLNNQQKKDLQILESFARENINRKDKLKKDIKDYKSLLLNQ